MNPFFFGPSGGQLYGLYYPPVKTDAPGDRGVIICQPVWQEYIRAHWACVQMAHALSKQGLHALLFDYFGTGDSAGAEDECTLQRWQDDIVTAAQELRDMAGITTYGIIGVRFGAALALKVCREKKISPFAIGLWDPILSGARYLNETISFYNGLAAPNKKNKSPSTPKLGFPVSSRLSEEINRFEIEDPLEKETTPFFLACSKNSPESDVDPQRCRGNAAFKGACFAPDEGGWLHGESFDKVMTPRAIPQSMVSFISRLDL